MTGKETPKLKFKYSDTAIEPIKHNKKEYAFGEDTKGFKFVSLNGNKDLEVITFETEHLDLQYIDASRCNIKKIVFSHNCPKLQAVYLHHNQLEDFEILVDLPALELLDLSFNETLTDLKISGELPQLFYLYLHKCNLKDLSYFTNHFTRPEFDFNIDENKGLQSPPVEIVEQGKEAVMNWFKSNKKKLNEIKILVVGDAEAGKTSVCNRLEFNTFNKYEKQTDGIKIQKYEFEKLETFEKQKRLHGLTGYFWDFGGQEIMKSTHQFFLTHRSVYILVLEARNDKSSEKQVVKWLENIQSQGSKSPIIIVINKIEVNRAFDIDSYHLKKEFPQIFDILKISCENDENISELKILLENCIPQAELFNTQIDERWIAIKNELQQKTKDKFKLTETDYKNICISHDLTDSSQQNECVKFLNDLGIVLHFEELDLAEYYVLDPLWVTTGVYRIITSEKAAKQSGIVLYENLKDVVNSIKIDDKKNTNEVGDKYLQIRYTPNESRYLVDIMSMFKLCFFAENKKVVFIPDLFAKETPALEVEEILSDTKKLDFIYDYQFLHHSVISRLIVEVNGEIQNFWRSGVIVKSKTFSATALIMALNDKVLIAVIGDRKVKRQYLSHIRFFIEKINEEFNLKSTMKIPLPGLPDKFAKYDHVQKLEKRGDKFYEDLDTETVFEICKLLEGIDSIEEIQKEAPNIIHNYITINSTGMNADVIKNATKNNEGFIGLGQPINRTDIFISYSHHAEDQPYFDEIRRQLKSLKAYGLDVKVWDDTQIRIGDNWLAEITKALQLTRVGILLVSHNFLGSEFIRNQEVPALLEAVEKEGGKIMPVILRKTPFQMHPVLKKYQAANAPGKPLNTLTEPEKDDVYAKLLEDILCFYGIS